MIDDPNDPSLRSFIDVAPDSPFPIQNLPFGVFSTGADGKLRRTFRRRNWRLGS